MSTESIRVLIVDDHPAVREGLSSMLTRGGGFTVIGEAENGVEAVNLAKTLSPEVILMDLRMPEMDGFEATARIQEENSAINIIVLTTYESDEDVFRAVEAGAKGYLLKDIPRQELFDAVRAVHAGESLFDPDATTQLPTRFAKLPRYASSIDLLADIGMEVEQMGDIFAISLKGRIDASVAPDIEAGMLDLVSKEAKQLVVDLSRVEFISSAGLKSLLAVLKEARAAAGDVRLSGIPERVNELLDVTGFSTLFRMYPDATDAARSYDV
jgi:anti-anti-sigma factor